MLPKIPKGFVTNFPNAVPDFIGQRQFIFLLSFVAVFILAIVFFLDMPQRLQGVSNTPPMNFEEVNFPSSRTKERVLGYVKSASAEKDSNKRFEHYRNVYGELLAVYTFDHDSKTRKQTENLSQFIASQFPQLYSSGAFTIPCFDFECGQPKYHAEIANIIERLQNIKPIEPLVLNDILKKLEAASISADSNFQWNNYIDVFNSLKSERRRTNDGEIAKVAEDLRGFLRDNFQEEYKNIESSIPGVFEI